MATTLQIAGKSIEETIKQLKAYRSGWANDIREGWLFITHGPKDITYELYEISGSIILALENRLAGTGRDKMAMHLTHDKLSNLVKSELFGEFSALGEAGLCGVVTQGTKHHIRVMFECLKVLMA